MGLVSRNAGRGFFVWGATRPLGAGSFFVDLGRAVNAGVVVVSGEDTGILTEEKVLYK